MSALLSRPSRAGIQIKKKNKDQRKQADLEERKHITAQEEVIGLKEKPTVSPFEKAH